MQWQYPKTTTGVRKDFKLHANCDAQSEELEKPPTPILRNDAKRDEKQKGFSETTTEQNLHAYVQKDYKLRFSRRFKSENNHVRVIL